MSSSSSPLSVLFTELLLLVISISASPSNDISRATATCFSIRLEDFLSVELPRDKENFFLIICNGVVATAVVVVEDAVADGGVMVGEEVNEGKCFDIAFLSIIFSLMDESIAFRSFKDGDIVPATGDDVGDDVVVAFDNNEPTLFFVFVKSDEKEPEELDFVD
jgi:hypothetical protein